MGGMARKSTSLGNWPDGVKRSRIRTSSGNSPMHASFMMCIGARRNVTRLGAICCVPTQPAYKSIANIGQYDVVPVKVRNTPAKGVDKDEVGCLTKPAGLHWTADPCQDASSLWSPLMTMTSPGIILCEQPNRPVSFQSFKSAGSQAVLRYHLELGLLQYATNSSRPSAKPTPTDRRCESSPSPCALSSCIDFPCLPWPRTLDNSLTRIRILPLTRRMCPGRVTGMQRPLLRRGSSRLLSQDLLVVPLSPRMAPTR